MDVRVGLWRRLSAKELMLLNCGVGEDSWDCKEIQPVHSKGDQSWMFFERTDAKAETPVLWLPHAKSWLIGKDSDAGRDWGKEERGRQRRRWLDGITDSMDMSEWTPGDGDGQGCLACCNSWGCKESDMTEQLNWTELNLFSGSDPCLLQPLNKLIDKNWRKYLHFSYFSSVWLSNQYCNVITCCNILK